MYLGNQPALSYTSFAKQDFTVTATTSYTLDHSVSNENEIALFINFVRQEPTTSYTASGTSLTLTEATSVGDDMYCVFIGKAVQTVNPADNTISNSMIKDGAIDNASLSSGSFSNITGTGTLTNFTSTGIDDNATNTAITIDSSENVTLSNDLVIPDKIVHDGDTNTAIRFNADDTISLETSGSERLRCASNGNVGINNTNPQYKLHLNGTTWQDTRVSIGYNANSNSGHWLMGVANYGAVNNGAKLSFRICTTGNSGGHVIRVKYRNRSGDAEGGESNGAYCNGTSWVNASDTSMKTNVTDLSYGLSTIADLQPRAFDWTDSGESDIGFIAQELDDHIPEVVSGEDGSKGVNYGALTAVLVKALQEAKTKIETLETQRADLEARVTALENA